MLLDGDPLLDIADGVINEEFIPPPGPLLVRTWSGTQKLCWAMLADVASCLTRYCHSRNPAHQRQYARDWEWLHAESWEPFSCHWTCAQLGLEPGWYVRTFLAGQEEGRVFHKSKNREWQKERRGIRLEERKNRRKTNKELPHDAR